RSRGPLRPPSRARAQRAADAALDVDQVRGALARLRVVQPRGRRRVEYGPASPRARGRRPRRARADTRGRRALQRRRSAGDARGLEVAGPGPAALTRTGGRDVTGPAPGPCAWPGTRRG